MAGTSTDDSMVPEIGGSPRGRAVGIEDAATEVAQREINTLMAAGSNRGDTAAGKFC